MLKGGLEFESPTTRLAWTGLPGVALRGIWVTRHVGGEGLGCIGLRDLASPRKKGCYNHEGETTTKRKEPEARTEKISSADPEIQASKRQKGSQGSERQTQISEESQQLPTADQPSIMAKVKDEMFTYDIVDDSLALIVQSEVQYQAPLQVISSQPEQQSETRIVDYFDNPEREVETQPAEYFEKLDDDLVYLTSFGGLSTDQAETFQAYQELTAETIMHLDPPHMSDTSQSAEKKRKERKKRKDYLAEFLKKNARKEFLEDELSLFMQNAFRARISQRTLLLGVDYHRARVKEYLFMMQHERKAKFTSHSPRSLHKIVKLQSVSCKQLSKVLLPIFNVKLSDDKAYEFTEADLDDLELDDLEVLHNLLMIKVEKRHHERDIAGLAAVVRSIRRQSIVLSVTDFQMAIEKLLLKVYLEKPDYDVLRIAHLVPYTVHQRPEHGVVFVDRAKSKRFMRFEELQKFCDGTLRMVRAGMNEYLSQNDEQPREYRMTPEQRQKHLEGIELINQRLSIRHKMRILEKLISIRKEVYTEDL